VASTKLDVCLAHFALFQLDLVSAVLDFTDLELDLRVCVFIEQGDFGVLVDGRGLQEGRRADEHL
jgi:hypothetical protein